MKTKSMIMALVALLFVCNTQNVHAQNGSVHTVTVTNKPQSGYEVRITFKYQFIWCYDEIKCVASIVSEEPLAYYYNGKRLTAADVSQYGGFNPPRNNRRSTMDINATLMYGQSPAVASSSSKVRLTNLIYAWGGCMGDTHDVFGNSNNGKDKSKTSGFYLDGVSADVQYLDAALERKMKDAAKRR